MYRKVERSYYGTLTRRVKHQRVLLNQFMKTWREEYLRNLRESHAVRARKNYLMHINMGDINVLKNGTSKPILWKLAKVEELLLSKNGKVRATIVPVADSKHASRLLRRNNQLLFPIEVNVNSMDSSTNEYCGHLERSQWRACE